MPGEGEELGLRGACVGLGGLKPGVPVAGMVGHDVQQVAHAARVQSLAQRNQRLVAAKMRVDVLVVGHVVLVVRLGGEDRVEIQRGDAQLLDIIQLLRNALQVAAVEDQREGGVVRRQRAPGEGLRALAAVFVLVGLRIVRRIAVGETVGEDLVEDGFVQPAGGIGIGQELEVICVQRVEMAGPGRVQPPHPVVGLQRKAVVHQRFVDGQLRLPPARRRLGGPGCISVNACSPSGAVRRKTRRIGASTPARSRIRTVSPRLGVEAGDVAFRSHRDGLTATRAATQS